MPSALETLVKILKLEQSTGYQDKAVIGGLHSFAENWATEAHKQAKKPEHHALIDELKTLIDGYSALQVTDQRHEAIKHMLGRITGRVQAPNAETPTAPSVESTPYFRRIVSPRPAPEVPPREPPPDQAPSRSVTASNRPAHDEASVASDEPAGSTVPTSAPREQRRNQRDEQRPSARAEVNPPAPDPDDGLPDPDEQAKLLDAIASEPPTPRTYTESLASGFERPDSTAPVESFSAPKPSEPLTPARRRRRGNDDPERRRQLYRALRSSVQVLDGVGPKNAEKLASLDLNTIEDVLYNFPRRYDDYTQMLPLGKLLPGMTVTAVGEVRNAVVLKGKRNQEIFNVTIGDGTGTLTATYFGMPYLRSSFERGMQIALRGKVDLFLGKLTMSHPEWEPVERDTLRLPQIVPVYGLSKLVKAGLIRKVSRTALNQYADALPDYMPETVLDRVELPDLGWALRQVHFPDSMSALETAQKRLSFDELILLQLGMLQNRREWQSQPSLSVSVDDDWYEAFLNALPYPLTGAQQRAVMAIREDIRKTVPMNRLLQGDVGAGKTVVAAAAMLVAVQGGAQAAIMAPTGILAEQHYKSITRLVQSLPGGDQLNIQLLTSATPAQQRADTLWFLGEGKVNILVGTHALLQDDVNFANLGLVVIDEQHRFGVEQRGKLRSKGRSPHVLVMTATPIPRTLALTMYADLDLSILDEMPPGRSPIDTKILYPRERQRAYAFIESQLAKERQAFIVYPLVEASESETMAEVKSAVEDFERLQRDIFPHRKLGLLHGKMSPAEKDAAMNAFSRNETQILVCTAVVEVGIDVPNATVMLIEGANRFGLAQLHQFRGRVGRGQHQSYCLLIPDDGDLDNERLRAMESTTDGFKLAEMDWELRGAGDLLGTRQSGGAARLGDHMDIQLVQAAQLEARTLYEEDPTLQAPTHLSLREKLMQRFDMRGETTDVS